MGFDKLSPNGVMYFEKINNHTSRIQRARTNSAIRFTPSASTGTALV
jgi:hypothetical protein